MILRALLEISSDADLLYEMIGLTAEHLMAQEVEELCGAGGGARNAERLHRTQLDEHFRIMGARNGTRP